jgi:diacylglycerol kinase (ATP)
MSPRPNDTPKIFSWRDRQKSFVYAFRGIKHVLRTQHNAWLHALGAFVVMLMGFAFRITATEWCCLIICLTVVWTAEALNTALELLTDLVSPEFHPLAGKCKDVAAGAVLIAAVGAGLVGAIVFSPYLMKLVIQ